MTERIPEGVRSNSRLTPLMINSFSKLHENSLNRTTDSGYQSSFASLSRSFTPSSDVSSSSSLLYCSTPVTEDSILATRSSVLTTVQDTPVQSIVYSRTRYSSDRIPCQKNKLLPAIEAEAQSSDVLSCLIRSRIRPVVDKIFKYLRDEDLFQLCQVSDELCRAICEDQSTIKRLSIFLINVQQNGENRTTSNAHNNRPYGGVLRPIHNVLSVNMSAGAVWTVPTRLETIDMERVPRQFQSLVLLTKSLSEHHYVTNCHTCRCFVAVRLHNQRPVECPSCSQRSRRINGRLVTKTKTSLFSSFR